MSHLSKGGPFVKRVVHLSKGAVHLSKGVPERPYAFYVCVPVSLFHTRQLPYENIKSKAAHEEGVRMDNRLQENFICTKHRRSQAYKKFSAYEIFWI